MPTHYIALWHKVISMQLHSSVSCVADTISSQTISPQITGGLKTSSICDADYRRVEFDVFSILNFRRVMLTSLTFILKFRFVGSAYHKEDFITLSITVKPGSYDHRMSRIYLGTTKYRIWLVCTGTNSIQIISGTNAPILEKNFQPFSLS